MQLTHQLAEKNRLSVDRKEWDKRTPMIEEFKHALSSLLVEEPLDEAGLLSRYSYDYPRLEDLARRYLPAKQLPELRERVQRGAAFRSTVDPVALFQGHDALPSLCVLVTMLGDSSAQGWMDLFMEYTLPVLEHQRGRWVRDFHAFLLMQAPNGRPLRKGSLVNAFVSRLLQHPGSIPSQCDCFLILDGNMLVAADLPLRWPHLPLHYASEELLHGAEAGDLRLHGMLAISRQHLLELNGYPSHMAQFDDVGLLMRMVHAGVSFERLRAKSDQLMQAGAMASAPASLLQLAGAYHLAFEYLKRVACVELDLLTDGITDIFHYPPQTDIVSSTVTKMMFNIT